MTSIVSTVGATTSRIAVRARDEKGKTCFVLYNEDGTFDQSRILDDNGAFNYSKEPDQFYAIASHLLTTEHVDEGTPAPDDWNTDADLDRLRRAQCVIVADMSVNPYGASGIAERLDHIAPNAWCVVIGAPPPQYVKGKTTFFLSDTTEGDQKTKHLKYIADPIVDKNDERVFILSTDLPDLLAEINSPPTPLVSGLIALSTPYEGRDEERAQELKRALAARRAASIETVENTDERTLKVLPPRLKELSTELAAKFHTSVFTASFILLLVFCAKQGHHRGTIKRGGGTISPYLGLRLLGISSTGKTGLVDYAFGVLKRLPKGIDEDDAARLPALREAAKQAETRHKAAFLALQAAKENGDPTEISSAKETEAKELTRLKLALKDLALVDSPPHNYLPEWASDKGIDWDLSQNEWSAFRQGKTPDGAIVRFCEGSDIFGAPDGIGRTKKNLNFISKILDLTPNSGKTVSHDCSSGTFGLQTIGACVITEEQPGTDVAGKNDSIKSQGGPNRFFWGYVPFIPDLPTLDVPNEKEWEDLIRLDLKVDALRLNAEAEKSYIGCREELKELRSEAQTMGDTPKAAFIGKLDAGVWRFARLFHLMIEGDRILKGVDIPLVKGEIARNTFDNAFEYCRIAIIERDRALDKLAEKFPARSLDAQTMYQHQVKYARDQWTNRSRFAASAPKLSLWTKANEERANAAEQELIDAGLWIIGQYGQKAGKRRAITIDEIAAPEKNAETTDNIPF